ncbi:hypothetical protein AAVH_11132 [Aphelenchoides avenae]|nr:hypothetical protein AAVH_11132 [Aphelenchus avenae]
MPLIYLPLLAAVFCGLVDATERLEGCKELVSLGYPEPRPLGEFLGRGQDGDGRFVLNSAFEHNFSSCNTDTSNRVVAPDGVDIIGLRLRTMHHRFFDVKEWEGK